MMNSKHYLPVLPGLAFILIVLKLVGVLTCGWRAVLSPLWVPAMFVGGLLLIVMLVSGMIGPQP